MPATGDTPGVFGLPAWASTRLKLGPLHGPDCVWCVLGHVPLAGTPPLWGPALHLQQVSRPGSGLRAAACLPLPAAGLFDACVPRPGRAGPCLGRHDSPTFRLWVPEGRGVGAAAAGTRPGPPARPRPQALPSQFTHFSPLISGPSIHCPQSSDGETEARKHTSRVDSGQRLWLPSWCPPWPGLGTRSPRSFPSLLSGSRRPVSRGWPSPAGFCQGWEQLIRCGAHLSRGPGSGA